MLKKLLLALAFVFAGAALTPERAAAAPFGPGLAGLDRAPATVDKAYYVYRVRYRPRRYYARRYYRPRYFARRYYRPRYYVPRRYYVRRVYRPVYRYRRFY